MDRVLLDLDIPVGTTEARHQFIVISRDINDTRPLAGFAQNFLDDVVVNKVKTAMAHCDRVIRIQLSGMSIAISRELATAVYLDDGYMQRGGEQLLVLRALDHRRERRRFARRPAPGRSGCTVSVTFCC